MDLELLSRIQFALTISFHYIYPPMSIGLGVILVMMEGLYIKSDNPLYHTMTRFWVSIFALIFGLGVATGIVMEFEFGTNWASYSRYVGDIFGSALAAEGIFAFFLESGFLAILVFGWNKVSKGLHFFSTIMVALGAMFSAVWIVVANSWQQTPAGYHIVTHGLGSRAEITDFWAMVFNPSSVERLAHTVSGAWLAGAFLVISVSAFYLLKNRHVEFARESIKIGLVLAIFASLFQLWTGHHSALIVAEYQPPKLAAMEGIYDTVEGTPAHIFGWVDDTRENITGLSVPGLLSYLVYGNFTQPVTGLREFPRDLWPPVNLTFQSYHIMITIGFGLIAVSLTGAFLWWRGTLFTNRPFLWLLVFSVLGPQIANQAGWWTAEVGRQPWIVYGLLRTSEGLSKAVQAEQVLASIIMFTLVYILLFALFIFLLDHKIRKGPVFDHDGDAAHQFPHLAHQEQFPP